MQQGGGCCRRVEASRVHGKDAKDGRHGETQLGTWISIPLQADTAKRDY